jgi:membrane dipeptidase
LTCHNILRVLEGAERVAREMQAQGTEAEYELYDKRPDLPVKRSIADVVGSFYGQGTEDT